MTDEKVEETTEKPKGKKDKSTNVKIYARVRSLMPWEPRKVSLSVKGNKVWNKTEKTTNEYTFQKVFGTEITNEQIFKAVVEPMIDNVLKGFNAVLIAYGQTGSGKTYSMLGKPNLGIVGFLPLMLKTLREQPTVRKLELSAVEAFGHHVARIELFDLYDPINQTPNWTEKKGNTSLDPLEARVVEIKDINDAHDKIVYAHAASHFAPTGKNPESSRGHVCFVAKVIQDQDQHQTLTSYFVMVDCAGSEGESAFTPDFISQVDKTTLMARRLEAGCINTGLSQLQIIFNELRFKGELSKMLGNGLRRILHPYINTRTYMAILFTLSPAVNNSKPTESTLKFAVTAGMVKVKPVKAELAVDLEKLVQQLRKHIEENDKLIDEQNEKISQLNLELEQVKQDGIASGNLAIEDTSTFSVPKMEKKKSKREKQEEIKKQIIHGSKQSTLPSEILKQLQELDAESEEEEEEQELDEMFKVNKKGVVSSVDIEKEMQEAFARMQSVAKGTDLVRGVVSVDDKSNIDTQRKDMAEQLVSTLDAAHMDVTEVPEEEAKDEDMFEEIRVDLDEMDETGLKTYSEETWTKIEENRQEQENLKQSQQTVVDHLLETNEWLFNALNEILNSSIGQ